MLVVNGVRAFLHGLYHLPNRPDAYYLAAYRRFQFVHAPTKSEELDRARQHNMYCWLTVGYRSGRAAPAIERAVKTYG
jgi:hypothetical protein